MPRSEVIRLEMLIPISSSWEPSGAGGLTVTIGNDISSATKGSSVRIVAGKKRSPAKPWASALPAGNIVNASPSASRTRASECKESMEISPKP
jgi:hypothetical protein